MNDVGICRSLSVDRCWTLEATPKLFREPHGVPENPQGRPKGFPKAPKMPNTHIIINKNVSGNPFSVPMLGCAVVVDAVWFRVGAGFLVKTCYH